jgi:hypothetical protein
VLQNRVEGGGEGELEVLYGDDGDEMLEEEEMQFSLRSIDVMYRLQYCTVQYSI